MRAAPFNEATKPGERWWPSYSPLPFGHARPFRHCPVEVLATVHVVTAGLVVRQEDVVECLCCHAAITLAAMTGNAKIGQSTGYRPKDVRL